jgi:hypothetical protein
MNQSSSSLLYITKVIRTMTLSNTLRTNAVFTGICGLICVLATSFVVAHAGVPEMLWIQILGFMLLAYVPTLLFAAWRPARWLVMTIIILDWGYVFLAIVFFLNHWTLADALGTTMVVGSAAFVALFAILQQRGLPQPTAKV